jgi:antitoxin component of RelBE/YafQ-DinJ toxin-antitoxin module
MSNAIGMFLRQIIIQKGIPFAMRLPFNMPVAFGAMTPAQLNTELEKGYTDVVAGRVHDIDDVVAEMEKDYGI